jgi:AcrR family transcriptional regulator
MAAVATKAAGRARPRVPRAVREEQMIEAATRIFGSRGYGAASMDEIATASGITKPMLYSYFGSKDGLYVACMERGEDALEKAVNKAVRNSSTAELRLWHGLVAVFNFFDEHPDLFAIGYPSGSTSAVFVEASARGRASMAGLLTTLFVDTAVGAGVDPDAAREAEPLAHALTGATIALLAWSASRPDEPRELHALRLMNFAWMGLGNLVQGELWVPPTDEEVTG